MSQRTPPAKSPRGRLTSSPSFSEDPEFNRRLERKRSRSRSRRKSALKEMPSQVAERVEGVLKTLNAIEDVWSIYNGPRDEGRSKEVEWYLLTGKSPANRKIKATSILVPGTWFVAVQRVLGDFAPLLPYKAFDDLLVACESKDIEAAKKTLEACGFNKNKKSSTARRSLMFAILTHLHHVQAHLRTQRGKAIPTGVIARPFIGLARPDETHTNSESRQTQVREDSRKIVAFLLHYYEELFPSAPRSRMHRFESTLEEALHEIPKEELLKESENGGESKGPDAGSAADAATPEKQKQEADPQDSEDIPPRTHILGVEMEFSDANQLDQVKVGHLRTVMEQRTGRKALNLYHNDEPLTNPDMTLREAGVGMKALLEMEVEYQEGDGANAEAAADAEGRGASPEKQEEAKSTPDSNELPPKTPFRMPTARSPDSFFPSDSAASMGSGATPSSRGKPTPDTDEDYEEELSNRRALDIADLVDEEVEEEDSRQETRQATTTQGKETPSGEASPRGRLHFSHTSDSPQQQSQASEATGASERLYETLSSKQAQDTASVQGLRSPAMRSLRLQSLVDFHNRRTSSLPQVVPEIFEGSTPPAMTLQELWHLFRSFGRENKRPFAVLETTPEGRVLSVGGHSVTDPSSLVSGRKAGEAAVPAVRLAHASMHSTGLCMDDISWQQFLTQAGVDLSKQETTQIFEFNAVPPPKELADLTHISNSSAHHTLSRSPAQSSTSPSGAASATSPPAAAAQVVGVRGLFPSVNGSFSLAADSSVVYFPHFLQSLYDTAVVWKGVGSVGTEDSAQTATDDAQRRREAFCAFLESVLLPLYTRRTGGAPGIDRGVSATSPRPPRRDKAHHASASVNAAPQQRAPSPAAADEGKAAEEGRKTAEDPAPPAAATPQQQRSGASPLWSPSAAPASQAPTPSTPQASSPVPKVRPRRSQLPKKEHEVLEPVLPAAAATPSGSPQPKTPARRVAREDTPSGVNTAAGTPTAKEDQAKALAPVVPDRQPQPTPQVNILTQQPIGEEGKRAIPSSPSPYPGTPGRRLQLSQPAAPPTPEPRQQQELPLKTRDVEKAKSVAASRRTQEQAAATAENMQVLQRVVSSAEANQVYVPTPEATSTSASDPFEDEVSSTISRLLERSRRVRKENEKLREMLKAMEG